MESASSLRSRDSLFRSEKEKVIAAPPGPGQVLPDGIGLSLPFSFSLSTKEASELAHDLVLLCQLSVVNVFSSDLDDESLFFELTCSYSA